MTIAALNPVQRQLLDIVTALGFGRIEGLSVRAGCPELEPAPRIVQSIKLDSAPALRSGRIRAEVALEVEFERLFDQLRLLCDGVVDVEVRHGAPFRLAVSRSCQELAR